MTAHPMKMKAKPAIVIVLLIWVLLVLVTLAQATTFWASTSGSGASCGTTGTSDPGSGYTTYLKGVTCLAAGDTLILRSGTYANDLDTNSTALVSGSSYTNAPVIKAKDGETAIVRSLNITSGIHHVIFGSTTGTLIFDAQSSTSFNDLVSVGAGSSHHIRFINVEIRNNNNGNLVSINELGSSMEFLGGHFHDAIGNVNASPQGGYCFYIVGDDNLIENAELNNCTGFGIHNYSAHTGVPDRNIYRNNSIHDMQAGSGYLAGTGLLIGSGDSNLAYNNLIYNNTGEGLDISNGSTNGKVYNNSIYNNGFTANNGAGCIVFGTDSGSVVKNNICYSNAGSAMFDSNPSGTTPTFGGNWCTSAGTGCANTGDPGFVSAGSANFSLSPTSSAIDTGVSSIATGITLSCAGNCDPGAYEVPKFASCSVSGTTLSITFDNPRFPPISNLATTGITATVDGTSRSLSSPTLVGTNQMNLTISGASASATASTVGSSVAVTDSASIGGSSSNVQKAGNWSSTPCTVSGGGGSAVLTQAHFRLHDLPGAEAAPKCLSASGSCTGMEGVNATVQKGGCFRCRAKISCTGAACATAGYIFRYSKNGGGYTVVPDTFGSDNIKFYGTADTSSEIPVQGTVTTALLTSDFGIGTPVTDAFTNLTNFTGSYTSMANMAITAGRARSATLSVNAIESHNTSIGLNQYAQVVLTTFNTSASYAEGGLILRASNSPTATFYYVVAGTDGFTYIYRFVAGVASLVASDNSQTWAAGNTLKAKIEGSNISVYRNGSTTAFMTYTDGSPLTGTKAGVAIYVVDSLADIELDSFEAGQTNTGTVVSGAFIRTSNAIPSIADPPQNSEWEIEGALCIDSDETVGTTYDFKLYNQNGTALDTYSAIPRVTVAAPALTGGISSATSVNIGNAACTQVTSTSQNCVTTIGWQASKVDATHSMPTNYLIRRADGGGNMAQIGTVLAANTSLQNTFTDSGATNHCYDVTATMTGSSSQPSNQVCWTSPPITPPTPPGAPQNFTVGYRQMRKAA